MTHRRISAIAGYLLLVLSPSQAMADEFYQHAVMNCASKSVWAEITTHGTYNDDPAPEGVSDCTLPGFGSVRLKVGAGAVYAYGQGYGEATMFVSVWVKQAKVVSRESFECADAGRCELRITVALDGLRVCRKPEQVESCTFRAWNDLQMQRDPMEYPIAGERVRPRNDSIATILARDKKFCAGFVPASPEASDIDLPQGAIRVARVSTGPWEYAGSYDYYDLDADNDGSVDHVVHLRARSHAYDADAMFVFAKFPVPQVKVGKLGETHSDEEYAKSADRVFPGSWHEKKSEIPAPWWDASDALRTPHFSIGGYFEPFTLRGKTYLIWNTPMSVYRHWKTVLEPLPDGSVVTQCAFQTVQPEF